MNLTHSLGALQFQQDPQTGLFYYADKRLPLIQGPFKGPHDLVEHWRIYTYPMIQEYYFETKTENKSDLPKDPARITDNIVYVDFVAKRKKMKE